LAAKKRKRRKHRNRILPQGHGARTPRRQETGGGTRRRDGVLVIRDWWLGFDEGRLAAKRRKRRKNRTAEDGLCHRGHGARTQRKQETNRPEPERSPRNTRKDLNRRKRRKRRAEDGGRSRIFVTEATERRHRGSRRRTAEDGGRTTDRPGGPCAPRAACSVKLGLALGELCEMVGFLLPEISRKKGAEVGVGFLSQRSRRADAAEAGDGRTEDGGRGLRTKN
jgi:hypothetical protein